MQKIERKKEKQLSSKLLISAAVIFLLLCTGAILLLNRPEEPARPETEELELLLYQKDLSLLSSITLYRNGEQEVSLLYQDGSLLREDLPETPLSESASESLLSLAQSLTADEFIMELPEQTSISLSPYGLDPAERSAVFRYADGTEISLFVGALMHIENPRYYAMVAGQNALYSVTQDVRDTVSRTSENLHPVQRPQINSELVDRITVAGDTEFDAVRTAQGWQMVEPIPYPLSKGSMDNLLSQLDNIRFAGWIGYADQVNLTELGLSEPRRTLTITFAETVVTAPDEKGQEQSFTLPSNQMSFALGNTRNDTSFYMRYEDQVYTGTVLSFSFLQNFSWEKYVEADPISSVPVQSLDRVILEAGGQKTVYDITYTERVMKNNEFETDEYGNILYDMRVSSDGKAVDADSFVRWYQSLSCLRGTQRTEQKAQTDFGDPLLSLTLVRYEDGFKRTVSVCPYSSVQNLLFVDGVSLYLIDSSWQTSMNQAP